MSGRRIVFWRGSGENRRFSNKESKQQCLCRLRDQRTGPHSVDSPFEYQDRQDDQKQIDAGESDDTAYHDLFHLSDSLQASGIDKLEGLEDCNDADEYRRNPAHGDKGLVVAEKPEEGFSAKHDHHGQNCGGDHPEHQDLFAEILELTEVIFTVRPADECDRGSLVSGSQSEIDIHCL